jgi:hypothetical protein
MFSRVIQAIAVLTDKAAYAQKPIAPVLQKTSMPHHGINVGHSQHQADRKFKRPCLLGACLVRFALVRGMGLMLGPGWPPPPWTPPDPRPGTRPNAHPALQSRASRVACPGAAVAWHRPQVRHAPPRPPGPLAGAQSPAPSNSKQVGLRRRCSRTKRQLALVSTRRGLLQVRKNSGDDLRLLDAGDDLEPAATADAALDLDTKDSLEPPCPVHGHVFGRQPPGRIGSWSCLRSTDAPVRGRHGSAQFAVRGEYTVIPGQVHLRRRHQRGKAGHEIQRLDHDVRGAVALRGLERVAHMAR